MQNNTRKQENRTDLSTVTPLETPYVLFVDPSSGCNFRCTFCPTGDVELIKSINRYQGLLKISEYEKIIDDLSEFEEKIKVLRLYKDGEPFLNKNLPLMVKLAKESGKVEKVDTTTNGVLITSKKAEQVIDAGIDLINISIDGIDEETFFKFTKTKVDILKLIDNIRYLHSIKGSCKLVIKTTSEIVGLSNENKFFDMFSNYADKIFIENTSPCWPDFDVEERMNIKIEKGLYGNEIIEQTACPYIFYSMSVNSDMKASACFVDWSRELIVGNVRNKSLKDIWNSDEFNAHRFAHLNSKRKNHKICGNCGQISHCGPDSIEDKISIIKNSYEKKGLFEGINEKLNEAGYSKKIIRIENERN